MGFFKNEGAPSGAPKSIDFTSTEKLNIEGRVIGEEESGYIDDAFRMLTEGSWSEEELAGFDLLGELKSPKTHRVGLFATIDSEKKLIGFAGVSPLGTPNFKGTEEYPKDSKDMWCGYFVIHPDFRNRIDVMQNLKALHDAVLGAALVMTKESGGRILACTENDLVRQALPRLGWVARGGTPIVDKNGTDIGPTSVFEYVRPQTNT